MKRLQGGKVKDKGIFKKLLFFIVPGLVTTLSLQAYASGYKMEFESTSILAGNGEAAAVEDAGTNWYNSAGNVYLPQQSVISIIDVYAPTTFTGTTTAPSAFQPIIGPSIYDFKATGSASAYSNSIIPAIHYVYPLTDRFAFGVSVVPAWGFKEDYGNDSFLRYDLTRVYTKTIDLAPSLAMKLNDHWSIGVGPDFNYFSVQSEARVRTEGPNLGFPIPPGTPGDSLQRFTANQWKTGWHAGVLFRVNDTTRIGLNYRSKIIMHMEGYSDFAVNQGPSFESDDFTLRIPLPAVTTLSAYHDVTPKWALLGTIAYDQWSVLNTYHATNVIQPPTLIGGSPTLINVNLPQNFGDTFDFSLGTHYKWNDKLMLRGSVKYEQTPTNDHDRDVNFPDGPKLGFQIGSRYQMNKRIALDLIYGHVFVWEVPINITSPVTFATTKGHSNTNIDLLGAQVVVNI